MEIRFLTKAIAFNTMERKAIIISKKIKVSLIEQLKSLKLQLYMKYKQVFSVEIINIDLMIFLNRFNILHMSPSGSSPTKDHPEK
jgi:hypothetical protein